MAVSKSKESHGYKHGKIDEKELEVILGDRKTPLNEDVDRKSPGGVEILSDVEENEDDSDVIDEIELSPEERLKRETRRKQKADLKKLKEKQKDWLPQPMSQKGRLWFGLPAAGQALFYIAILILTAINPSPTWYNFFNIIITFLFFVPGLIGCIFGTIGAAFFEKKTPLMLKFLNFYRITQYYVAVFGPFANQYVGSCLAFEIRVLLQENYFEFGPGFASFYENVYHYSQLNELSKIAGLATGLYTASMILEIVLGMGSGFLAMHETTNMVIGDKRNIQYFATFDFIRIIYVGILHLTGCLGYPAFTTHGFYHWDYIFGIFNIVVGVILCIPAIIFMIIFYNPKLRVKIPENRRIVFMRLMQAGVLVSVAWAAVNMVLNLYFFGAMAVMCLMLDPNTPVKLPFFDVDRRTGLSYLYIFVLEEEFTITRFASKFELLDISNSIMGLIMYAVGLIGLTFSWLQYTWTIFGSIKPQFESFILTWEEIDPRPRLMYEEMVKKRKQEDEKLIIQLNKLFSDLKVSDDDWSESDLDLDQEGMQNKMEKKKRDKMRRLEQEKELQRLQWKMHVLGIPEDAKVGDEEARANRKHQRVEKSWEKVLPQPKDASIEKAALKFKKGTKKSPSERKRSKKNKGVKNESDSKNFSGGSENQENENRDSHSSREESGRSNKQTPSERDGGEGGGVVELKDLDREVIEITMDNL